MFKNDVSKVVAIISEHSEIVSRSVSLMMASNLERSFLKYGDTNYFIYPFLCYNKFFCIVYRFCRINFWNVVLLFGSLCISEYVVYKIIIFSINIVVNI
jgi:hypothetical protein